MNRAAWLKWRQRRICGTDVGRILGLSPFGTGWDVLAEKEGRESTEETDEMRVGRALEPAVATLYTWRTGEELVEVSPCEHPDAGWAGASPDREWKADRKHGVEIKTTSMPEEKWAAGGEPPGHVLAQVQWYAGICGWTACDVVVLYLGSRALRIYEVKPDPDLFRELLERMHVWRATHWLGREPLPLEATPSCHRALGERLVQQRAELAPATPRLDEVAGQLAVAKNAREGLEAGISILEAELKLGIGEGGGLEGAGWKATWNTTKPSKRTDWKALAEALLEGNPEGARLKAEHTAECPGARRFLFKWQGALPALDADHWKAPLLPAPAEGEEP